MLLKLLYDVVEEPVICYESYRIVLMLYRNEALLEITGTGIHSLGLRSLKKIGFGEIKIVENRNLCFVQSINWTSLQEDGGVEPHIYSNSATCG